MYLNNTLPVALIHVPVGVVGSVWLQAILPLDAEESRGEGEDSQGAE